MSPRTVRRRLREKNLKKCLTKKKPFISTQNKTKRLAWARKHAKWPLSKWKRVFFTDESPYTMRTRVRQYAWRTPTEKWDTRCLQGTVKHDKKINVWGGFTWNGVSNLHRIRGIMDKHMYRQILIHQAMPSANRLFSDGQPWIFQQDNDPKHTSGVAMRYLANKGVEVLEWVGQSPDLNPIENLWSDIDRQSRRRKCKTEEELFAYLKKTWEEYPVEKLRALIASMPARCRAVIAARGGSTKY